ncbi:FkbM family methyltransferase [Methylobacterium carpenticola]|uniref:FkbM family methyltransferase n=1 Tax=Methylobacterium carpenticola TaxID=3344827 RepID=UPI003F883D4C
MFADIGTNIGNHAIFAERILKAPEVIVFEPNPVAIDYMNINFALNECRNINRQYLGHPISDVTGKAMHITLSPENNLGNTVFGLDEEGPFRTITGDHALAKRPVGFIKIDTELMEFETLRGLERTLERWRPTVFVEVMEEREGELAAWAAARGYRIAESQKRYLLLRNYVLVPVDPLIRQVRQRRRKARIGAAMARLRKQALARLRG